ncbi:Sensor protein ZraS [Maioricimonas rarisocia]|uniref:histidine kinase n=1 Tax=Maioricimonas rarisocia TaxID=2528026 RepID=A0A517Z8M2_9PLAN|nr:Sensor protein ZraS [Maioricimonas rarisocia]
MGTDVTGSRTTLLVLQGADQGIRFEIGGDVVTIGRGAQNDVRILDTEVSRRHATLQLRGGGYGIVDAGSSNGTFVNGRPTEGQQLKNGDQIQIGRTVLLFTQTSIEDPSHVASRVNLVATIDEVERSQIVGSVGRDAGQALAESASAGYSQVRTPGTPLDVLYQITEEAVRPNHSMDQVLQRILDLTLQAVGADRGCMLVADNRTDRIEPRVLSFRPGVASDQTMPVSTSIVEYVIQHGHGVRTSDARRDERFDPGHSILQSGIREAMCVPMQGRYELMGIIYVDTTTPNVSLDAEPGNPHRFGEDLLALLSAIGRQSALAVEINRYQQALVSAERLAAVGQTIATLSHHIKNILQGIRGGSYLIDMGLQDENNELVRKGWDIVDRNQERIYHLVMDMLTFSKERQPALARGNVNETVREVCELMQGRARECHVTLQLSLDEQLPQSQFDGEGIHRAVLNILTNAIDALDGRDDGRVVISTGLDEATSHVFVEIADNGPGIAEAELPRLFNIFESSKGSRGTGLGLAVSQKILREHGGEITAKSRLGEGATFRLEWPAAEDDQDDSHDVTGQTESQTRSPG